MAKTILFSINLIFDKQHIEDIMELFYRAYSNSNVITTFDYLLFFLVFSTI